MQYGTGHKEIIMKTIINIENYSTSAVTKALEVLSNGAPRGHTIENISVYEYTDGLSITLSFRPNEVKDSGIDIVARGPKC